MKFLNIYLFIAVVAFATHELQSSECSVLLVNQVKEESLECCAYCLGPITDEETRIEDCNHLAHTNCSSNQSSCQKCLASYHLSKPKQSPDTEESYEGLYRSRCCCTIGTARQRRECYDFYHPPTVGGKFALISLHLAPAAVIVFIIVAEISGL